MTPESFYDDLAAYYHLVYDNWTRIAAALRRFREVLRPGGVCVVSLRGYDAIDRDPRLMFPLGSETATRK